MQALCLINSPEPLTLGEENIPRPEPGPGEMLVCVYAAGVTPTEILWYPTSHKKSGERRDRAVPGHEFSGVIASVGEKIARFDVGQEVYGMNDWFSDGALAEYCLTQPGWIAPKPSCLTHIEAASVPIGALTAWQGLFDRARLQAGERVLVHGGAGSVGVYAIQFAQFRGAHVIATASARNLDFISQLGADEVIDYQTCRFEDGLKAVDVVFDTVGGETLERSWSILKPHGRMITIASGNEDTPDERAKQAFFIVEPNSQQLAEIGRLVQAGHIQPVVDAVVPLQQASDAFTGKVCHKRGRGKVVVTVTSQESSRQPL